MSHVKVQLHAYPSDRCMWTCVVALVCVCVSVNIYINEY